MLHANDTSREHLTLTMFNRAHLRQSQIAPPIGYKEDRPCVRQPRVRGLSSRRGDCAEAAQRV
jgi:hypothetical protein